MFHMLPESEGKVVGVRAEGALSDADYKEFLPKLEEIIAAHGPIRMLVDMRGFEGWEPMAAWDDFAFGMTHWTDFECIALVGDKTWEEMSAKLFNVLMKGEVRFFDLADKDAAWRWVKE